MNNCKTAMKVRSGRFRPARLTGAPKAEPKYASKVAIMNKFQPGVPADKQRVNVTHK